MKRCTKYLSTIVLLLGLVNLAYGQLDLDFETDRGIYNAPFNLELTVNDPGAVIRYTTNGTAPTTSQGTVYTGPVPINTTTYIRAIAYTGTEITKVSTHTYIFPTDVINQPNSAAGFPTSDFEFDASIKNNPAYSGQLLTALTQTPSISLVMDMNDLNAMHEGDQEHATSVELIFPDGTKGYQANAGVKRAGATSFNSRKRNLRLAFRSIYGDPKFEFPIFGEDAADEFDQIALRPGFHACMHEIYNWSGSNDIADQVIRNLQVNMAEDEVGIHGIFTHLYINGIYWGVYNPSERGTNAFGESYYGGVKEDFDAIKRKQVLDGTIDAWNTLNNMVDNLDMSVPANYQAVQEYVQVEQFADYNILCNYAAHGDDYPDGKNSFVTRDRTKTDGFRFWIWDTEPGLGHYWRWNVADFGTLPYNNIFLSLLNNSDYKMLVADRLECHCFNDGALTPANAIDEYMEVYNSTNVAMIAEAARWVTNTEYDEFVNTKNRITNEYLPTRAATTIQLYKDNGVYPNMNGVQFSQYGGAISTSDNITLNNPNGFGTIYYTTDGTDPRASGGGISASAQIYSGSISFPPGVTDLKARVKSGSTWSAMCPPRFYIAQSYNNVVINEIMYHPDSLCTVAAGDSSELDYIELHNAGTEAVNLADCSFTDGIDFDFPFPTIMQPGDLLVLVENSAEFQAVYGFIPFGQYKGSLSNDGERLELSDPFGNSIDSLSYNDKNPWDEDPDGNGTSLELLDPSSDNNDPINWFRSDNNCGTPGAANSRVCTGAAEQIIINEINYNSDNGGFDPGDWVELYNPTASTIDLSNWNFYDNNNNFIFPSGTNIAAGEYLVLVENEAVFSGLFPHLDATQYLGDFTFGLSNKGERVSLFDENKCLSDYLVYNDRLPWDTIPDGNGPTLSLISPNSDNTLPLSWEASSNIGATHGTPGRANEPCLIQEIIAPDTICLGFSAMLKLDVLDENATYNWFLSGSSTPMATTDSVSTSWANAGTYNIQLVSNYFECTKIYTQQIVVEACNTAPNPSNDFYTIAEDDVLNNGQGLLANDNDPEGDNLLVSATPISPPANGTLSLNANGTFTYTPNLNFNGNDSFEYEVCDDGIPQVCNTAMVDVTITPVNDAPIAVDDTVVTQEDNSSTGNLFNNDSEPDGDNLTLSTTPVNPPQNGNVVILPSGFYAYIPNDDFNGTDSFTYEICDDSNLTLCTIGTVYVTVNSVNDAPLAIADTATIGMDEMLSMNVLINDIDVDGDVLTANVNMISPPTNGSVTIQANGDITYQPNTGYAGTDSFVYEACDPDGLCSVASATIEIQPGCIELNIYAYLEGPYDAAIGEMTTKLNTLRGLLPGQTPLSNIASPTPAGQPYNMLPWNYTGTEGAAWTDANYTDDVVDWVLVSARTDIQKSSEVGRAAGVLYKDGSISLSEGCPLENLGLDSLYIVIEHRNHIGIMTPQKVPIINNELSYDFRLSDSYKDVTSFGQKQASTGNWLMFAGDVDQSDFPSFDISGTDKTLWLNSNGLFQQYLIPDFDLNGDVNGADKVLWDVNNGVSSRVPK